MAFKVNISHKGKAYKAETDNEVLIGKKIGESISGSEINADLAGYELKITGTSDIAGIPGFAGLEGEAYHKVLRTYGKGMKDRRSGIRIRKTSRGEEISLKTVQINMNVVKEGSKKFASLFEAKEEKAA